MDSGTNPALNVKYHDTGLNAGTYTYRLQWRSYNEVSKRYGEWGNASHWVYVLSRTVNITKDTVSGTMLFDDAVNDATIFGSVTIPEGIELNKEICQQGLRFNNYWLFTKDEVDWAL